MAGRTALLSGPDISTRANIVFCEDFVKVRVGERCQLEELLDAAEAYLRGRAVAHGDRGILVTRHSSRDFVLRLHADVPFGFTREQQFWRQSVDR